MSKNKNIKKSRVNFVVEIKSAIQDKCLDCSCGNLKAVESCHFVDCHLFPFRCCSDKEPKGTTMMKAIKTHCVRFCMNHQFKEVKKCNSKDCPLHGLRLG